MRYRRVTENALQNTDNKLTRAPTSDIKKNNEVKKLPIRMYKGAPDG